MKYLIILLKGIAFGIANLIPGVSGGTIAVITGVYEKLIYSINNLFKDFKNSIKFLIPFGVGILLAVVLGSKLFELCLTHIPIPTTCLFMGFVLGGIPSLAKPLKKDINALNIIIAVICFILVTVFLFIDIKNNSIIDFQIKDYFILFLCGLLASVAMVLPGLSGMLIIMLFGYYDLIQSTLANLTDFSLFLSNLKVILPVGAGVVIGIFSACKIFSILLKKYPKQCSFAIVGFVIASVICILFKMKDYNYSVPMIIGGIIMIPIGFIATYYMSKFENKRNENEALEQTNDASNEINE